MKPCLWPECQCSEKCSAWTPPAPPTEGMIRRVWNVVLCGMKGLRTLLTCLAIGLGGVLDQFDVVDILNFIRQTFGNSARLGTILIVVAVLFLCLRLVTKGPVSVGRPVVKGGVDEGV